MNAFWKSGPPQAPGLYVLDHGSNAATRLTVVWVEEAISGKYIRAHLAIPEPPQSQSIKVRIPLPQSSEPFNLPDYLRDNPEATLEALIETLAKLGVRELEIPPELEGHPLVKAAIQAIHGREMSFLDLQNIAPQAPQALPQTPQSGFRSGAVVEVLAQAQGQEPMWHRAMYVHHLPNGLHHCRINTKWSVEVIDQHVRTQQPQPTPTV